MNEQNFSSPTPSSPPSFLDKMIENAPLKRLQYLRGKEGALKALAQWVATGFFAAAVALNLGAITNFFDNLVNAALKGVAVLVMVIVWYAIVRIVGSKPVQEGFNFWIDDKITRLARWLRSRGDKFKEAQFNIGLVRKFQELLDMALTKLNAAYQTVFKSSNAAKQRAQEAGMNATGLKQELERRHNGSKTPAVSIKVGQLTDREVQEMFERSIATLRSNYQFYQAQGLRLEQLSKRCTMVQEVSRMTRLRIQDMVERLALAKENYENAKATDEALTSAADVVDSQATRDYEEAIAGINHDIDLFGGHVQMLMDRLDPTVQNYRADQAGSDIKDADFFRAWIEQTNADVDPNVERQIFSPTEKPVIDDIEQLLGTRTQQPRSSTRISQQPQRRASNIDDLLQ